MLSKICFCKEILGVLKIAAQRTFFVREPRIFKTTQKFEAKDRIFDNIGKVVLYQPDIALNVGAIIRTVACLGGELHIIEPCGFVFDEQKIRRSAMDYYEKIQIIRHDSFEDFYQNEVEKKKSRLILLTTKTDKSYHKFHFLKNDLLLFGRESAGVPESVANKADFKITIPMQNDTRSLNLASSVAIILAHFKVSF